MNSALEVIIDYSNSMGDWNDGKKNYLLPDGNTRMSLAKKVLIEDIIPALDYSGDIRITTFYSVTDSASQTSPVIKTIYEGTFQKNDVISKIDGLSDPVKTGGTPISAALEDSINNLKKLTDSDRKIVLITDGEETDGGDFRVTAEKAFKDHDINYNIFIIGIGQSASTAGKCKQLTDGTKGGYVNLETKNYDKSALSDVLRPLTFKAVETTISNIQKSTESAIASLEKTQNDPKENLENNKEFNDELFKILRDQAGSIELVNRQLANLEESIKSNARKADLCLEKIGAINLNEGLIKVQTSFKDELSLYSKNNLSAFTEVNQKIEAISKEVAQMGTAAKDVTRLNQLESNLTTQLQSIQKSVEQCRTDIEKCSSSIASLSSVGYQLKNIQDRVDAVTIDLLYTKETMSSVQSAFSALLKKQEKSDRKRNIALGVISFVLLAFMSLLVVKLKLFK